MKNLKKVVSMLITLCLVLCCSVTSLTASAAVKDPDPEVGLMYLYTNTVTTNLSKSGTNSIYYKCSVSGKVSIYVYLQRYNNGTWENVDAANNSASGRSLTVSDTYGSAVKGAKYRTEAHVYVYSGSAYEYIEAFSSTLTFT